MMILRASPPSPFGRKVKIAASLLGLEDQITLEGADTSNPADPLRQLNPVGKIPILIIESGEAIYDSPVIVEYLDQRAGGGRVIPAEPAARIRALTLAAMCDGMLDAMLLLIYEVRFRTEELRVKAWVDYQTEKVTRGMSVLEKNPPSLDQIQIGQIGLACTLGYQDLRFKGEWRGRFPRLVAWHDEFAKRVPAFLKTKVEP